MDTPNAGACKAQEGSAKALLSLGGCLVIAHRTNMTHSVGNIFFSITKKNRFRISLCKMKRCKFMLF